MKTCLHCGHQRHDLKYYDDVPEPGDYHDTCVAGIRARISLSNPAIFSRDLCYRIALRGVREVDEHLKKGVRHYRNRAGVLLQTLDEVVRGMQEDNLREPLCQ